MLPILLLLEDGVEETPGDQRVGSLWLEEIDSDLCANFCARGTITDPAGNVRRSRVGSLLRRGMNLPSNGQLLSLR